MEELKTAPAGLVDRVARALIDADPSMSGYHETHIAAKRPAARAAIEAMRLKESDLIMLSVVETAVNFPWAGRQGVRIINAYIDAALAEANASERS